MKVSVIIPAHNEEKFLPEALRAILGSDYPDFEVIVVDNASSDGTYEAAVSMGVKVVKEPNRGTQHARERGRAEASGEIIANMDADCVPGRDWLKRGAGHFKNPEIAALTGPADYYDGSGIFRFVSFYFQKIFYRLINSILNAFHGGGVLLAGNCFIRKSSLDKIGGYDTSIFFYGDDTDTAKRLSRIGRIAYDPKLTIKTSARRFKSQGIVKTEALYVYHFLKTLLWDK